MTNIQFKAWQCNDTEPIITQEDGLRKILAFSGVHEAEAVTVIPDPTIGYGWDSRNGVWNDITDGIEGEGNVTDQWYKIIAITDVKFGFVVDFDCSGPGGVVFGSKHDDLSGYLVWWSATQAGLSRLTGVDGYAETAVTVIPNDQVCPAHVRVMAKPVMATSIDKIDDLAISLSFDDMNIFSHAIQYDPELGQRLGIAVKGDLSSTPTQFTHIEVQQFHQLIEVAYIGPTEQAGSALSRIVGMDKIRVQARFDGTAKIWRNDLLTTDVEFDTSEIRQANITEDLYAPNHFELVGGMYQADVLAGYSLETGAEQWRGHLFTQTNDPNVLTEMETFARARRKAIEAVEAAEELELTVKFNPFLEAEDVLGVTFPYSDTPVQYRITSLDFQAVWSETGVRYEHTIKCRRLISAF
jgi:hypothetical protein